MSKTPITDAFADLRVEIARLTAEHRAEIDAERAEADEAVADLRGEIERLTAELAAARAVPPDVEEAIDAAVSGSASAAVASHRRHAHLLTEDRAYTVPRLKAAIARAIAEASQPATVGGLLATGTVRDLLGALPVVEWFDAPDWHQARIVQHGTGSVKGAEMRWRHERAASWASWRIVAGVAWRSHMVEPARLVPASEADADPATRGPLPKGG